jgi:hypothetical protein
MNFIYFVYLGLYKCVVSNPVGTTATTATLKVDRKCSFFYLRLEL